MRIVVQRVSRAAVHIDGITVGQIQKGLLILVGVEAADEKSDADWLVNKMANLRVFDDSDGVMNLSLCDVEAEALVISQFTLHAKYKKGNRPSYTRAAYPDHAIPLYEYFVKALNDAIPTEVQTGEFGADMQVELVNDGPVTIVMDTKNKE
jgi:D-tyrosyl-tRNA(Tyr) deacylase